MEYPDRVHIPNWFELQNTIEKCTISKRFELWNIMMPLSILIWYSLNVGLTPPPYRKPFTNAHSKPLWFAEYYQKIHIPNCFYLRNIIKQSTFQSALICRIFCEMHIPNRFDLQNIIKKYTFQTALICGILWKMHIPNHFELCNIMNTMSILMWCSLNEPRSNPYHLTKNTLQYRTIFPRASLK